MKTADMYEGDDYFSKSIDVDGMLDNDAVWLSLQVKISTKEFIRVANRLELRPQDWSKFWKRTRIETKKSNVEKVTITCRIFGTERELTQEEFDFVKKLLGEAPEQFSDCCGYDVAQYNPSNHTSRCLDCKENCGVVYVWGE